jgi:hypothetical protein
MELVKDIVIFIIVPIVAFLYKLLWDKCSQIEALNKNCRGYTHCHSIFALKSELATKQDISDILDAKFQHFELRLINEGRLQSRIKN